MFKFVVVCALLACAAAQHHSQGHEQSYSKSDDVHAEVKHYNSDVHEHGFEYGYETSNKIRASAAGDEHGNHQGDFEWESPEGEHINVKYVANENGYQPQSDVLPTPHPIPEAILRAIKYIEEHGDHEEGPVHHGGRRV